jgi:hypothetical protein
MELAGLTGLEPATTSLDRCSSTSIRSSETKQKTRQSIDKTPGPRTVRIRTSSPKAYHVVLPAFAPNLEECARDEGNG